MSHNLAQSPDELFDVLTYPGYPTGEVKRRADVHRDGDWHAAIHVWVVGRRDGHGIILFQQRSLEKDTFGGKLDATVGGHLNAGETWQDAIRETEEEIGVPYDLTQLVPLGRRAAIGRSQSGILDNEIQFVFAVRDERPLTEFGPNPFELAGLVQFRIEPLLELLAGNESSIAGDVIRVGQSEVVNERFCREDFATLVDRYYYRVAIAAKMILAGERHFSI